MKSEKCISFCKWWHRVIVVLHLIGCSVFWIAMAIHDMGSVSGGIMMGLMSLIAGTFCFLIVPAIFIAISIFTRFVPVIGLPVFIIYLIGYMAGDDNFRQFSVLESFLMGLGASAWGVFNIWTAIIANKDEDFNPVYLANE